MPDLRERLRVLDDLEVPDVMQQARRLGPKAQMEAGPRPVRRIAIAAFALLVAAASVLYVTRAFDRSEAPLPPIQTPEQPTTCRWNTTQMAIPNLGTPGRSAARLVAGTSLDDLWVTASNNPWLDQYLLHYDGQDWREVELPDDLHRAYSGDMVAPASNDLWVLGVNGVDRFDGTTWKRSNFPGLENADQRTAEFTDLEVIAPNDAWVTGNIYDQATQTWGTTIQHWDGTAWSSIDARSSGTDAPDRLVAVSAWAPDDVWIAGGSGGDRSIPVALHWDGSAWTNRAVHLPGVRAAAIDTFGLVATGPDQALLTTKLGVVRWDGGGWVDSGFDATSDMDVPLDMERGTSGVWAKVWNSSVARWNGETWRVEGLKHVYSYGMTVIDDAAVFVGDRLNATIYDC